VSFLKLLNGWFDAVSRLCEDLEPLVAEVANSSRQPGAG
jgi:hypothetical protein